MSNAISEVADRKERPPYVRFERVPVEDKAATMAAGHYVAKDVDYALVTAPYSKDVFKQKMDTWLKNLEQDAHAGRIPTEWIDDFKKKYEYWKNGQEIPIDGIPIKGWGVISPAQQETLIRMNIFTVEDLAGVNDEGMKRIGMGALDHKNKAQAWLDQINNKGKLTLEMAALKQENELLLGSLKNLEEQMKLMQGQLQQQQAVGQQPMQAQIIPAPQETITASDILDDGKDEPI